MNNARHLRAFGLTFAAFVGGLLAGQQTIMTAYADGGDPYAGLRVFARSLTQIQTHYVEERDAPLLIQSAIQGMADDLDPHSGYYDAETFSRLMDDTEGTTTGVGVMVVAAEAGGIQVEEVIAQGPADLAGLKAGDRIHTVDGVALGDATLSEAVQRVKGPRGTPVVLGIDRGGEQLEITVVRDEILTPSVSHELVEPGLGYVRVEEFRRQADEEFGRALEALGPLDALIIDLRNNPGGLLDEAVEISERFLDGGLIVETRGRGGKATDETHEARPGGDLETRVVVLINGSSASASEIVAGALQDRERAVVVGEASYGKGSVQSFFEHEDGSALRLTIARYYLPSGRHLERGAGVEPDHVLALHPSTSALAELTRRLDRSSLSATDKAELQALVDQLGEAEGAPERPLFAGTIAERVETDRQLAKALTLARAKE